MSELKEYLCIEAKTIEHEDRSCYRFTSATKSAPEACMEPVYLKSEADKVIAELKDKCEMHDFFWEGCGFARRGFKNTISVSEEFDRIEAENVQLKESVAVYQRNEKFDIRDIRQLKRALWLARANSAEGQFLYWCARFATESGFTKADIRGYSVNTKRKLRTIGEWIEIWKNVKLKAEERVRAYYPKKEGDE